MKQFLQETKGIIPVFKPVGPTSFQIISRLRRLTGIKKIGHAGTLDPLASGVLIVGIGREATKKIHFEVAKEKEYEAEITLGVTSTTDDEEGEKQIQKDFAIPSQTAIETELKKNTGIILQTPPNFSAIKINGQPAYKTARKGKTVILKPRKVEIKKIDILDYSWPVLAIKVITGPGVYIRSLARDIGQSLETGAYLSKLTRTRVGAYTLDQAYEIDRQ